MAKKSSTQYTAPEFLLDLLSARSPSGYEAEAHLVLDRVVQPIADIYEKDALGNRLATLNPSGNPKLLLTGHMDELGLMITYVDDKGFLYFDTIGGHDTALIPGRRLHILTSKGVIPGITGKRAIHLMTAEERKKVPENHDLWIDIGAKDKKEALSLIAIGDVAVYDQGFMPLRGSVGVARAFDDKAGCYAVMEALIRLKKETKRLKAQVVSVGTSQEEIGVRGAITAGYSVNPDLAIAVDVTHATDHPGCDPKRFGECKLGEGPMICRGPNINPFIFKRLVDCAEGLKIPYQIEADPRPTGTDARVLQIARSGVATGLVSIPLRYMHTPAEMVDLEDVEATVQLLTAFALSLKKGENGHW